MAKRKSSVGATSPRPGRPSSLVDTRVIYCGDNREKLPDLPDACIDLIYIDRETEEFANGLSVSR